MSLRRLLGAGRGTYLLMLAIATMVTLTKGIAEIVYPPYLAGYGYSLSFIGLLTSLIGGFQLISRVPSGVAYRPERAKRLYAAAFVVFGLSTIGLGSANGQLLPVALLSAIHGFAFGALSTLSLAIAIEVSGGKRVGAAMAWFTATNSTGYAIGYYFGGLGADTIGIPATLALAGLVPFVAAAAVFALPALVTEQIIERGKGIRGLLAATRGLDSRVWLALVIVLFLNTLQDSLDTFFPVFAPTIGITLTVVGALRAIRSGAGLFIRFGVAVLLTAVDYRRTTLIAVVAAALAAIAIPLSSSFLVLAVLFIVLGLTRGILRATSAASIAELRGEGKDIGLASGVYSAGLDLGAIIGPTAGGAVASVIGIGPMFQVIAVAGLALWLAVAVSTPQARDAAGLSKRHTIGPNPPANNVRGEERSG